MKGARGGRGSGTVYPDPVRRSDGYSCLKHATFILYPGLIWYILTCATSFQ